MISRYRYTALFYVCSTLIPWGCWFGAAWISRYDRGLNPFASFLALAGLVAPVAVAGILIGMDKALRRDFMSRLFHWRAPARYYLLACGLMPLSIVAAQGFSLLLGYDADQFIMNMQFSFTSGVFPVWLILIGAPVLEELAWHSYGTDCLRRKYNQLTTSIIFALYWGIWHMPLSTIPDYYHNELVMSGWIYSVNFLLSIFPFVILMNWIYYKTERNITVTIIFHITAGLFNELFSPHPDSKLIQTVILIVITLIVVMKDKNSFFCQKEPEISC
jgi:hypothetical protein